MKKQKKSVIGLALKTMAIALVLSLNSPVLLPAFDDEAAGYYMRRLINEARVQPGKVMSYHEIVLDEEDRQELAEKGCDLDLENGLPPLAWNADLAITSSEHTDDMISVPYYGYGSPDNPDDTVEKRIERSGYEAKFTGESLGLLAFNVYLEPLDAVEKLFENMLKDELDPTRDDQRNIFNRDYTEIGIGFRSANFLLDGQQFNAYVVTVDFAAPLESRAFIMGHFYYYDAETSSSSGDYPPDNYVVAGHEWLYENPVPAAERPYILSWCTPNDLVVDYVDVFFGYQKELPSCRIEVKDSFTGSVIQQADIKVNNQLIDVGIERNSDAVD